MLTGVLALRLPLVSLLASLSLATSSCLVTSVDSFPDPPSTPPFLSGARASPPLDKVVLIPDPLTAGPIDFTAYVRSEDAGVGLEARLVADWPSNGGIVQVEPIPAGAFSQERLITLTWDPKAVTLSTGERLKAGCHPFTLVVSHRFNLLNNTPASSDDADFLVWWVIIGSPDLDLTSFNLSACPTTLQLPVPATGAP